MKQDGRKLSHQTLEELRIRTVRQVQGGESPEVLAKALGLHRSTIYKWLEKNAAGGEKALKAKPIPGRPATLQVKHLKWLARTLIDKTPWQLKLPFALWTRDQIITLIKRQFGIQLSKSALSRALQKLGYTFQKPTTRFKQQDPVIVHKWLTQDYKAIQEQARQEGAIIMFGDEAGASSQHSLGKTIGKKGVTPVVTRTTLRFRVNMLSAVGQKGECRFMVTEQSVNASVFVEFLRRLMQGQETPIFLILDNHPIHKSQMVQNFVTKQNGKLKLFFLPPYSPELNPDEMVWNDVKNHNLSRHLVDSLTTLKSLVYRYLFRLQKRPSVVQGFFRTPTTAYTLA